LALFLSACESSTTPHDTWSVFGSQAELTLPAETSESDRTEAARIVATLWQQREHDWHAWQPSTLTEFNSALHADGEALAPLALRNLLSKSAALQTDSQGWFDPGVGRLVAMWGFHTSDYPVRTPALSQMDRNAWAAQPDSLMQLHCNAEWHCRTENRALQLDFNAIAEGEALDEGSSALRAAGIANALLNLGGDVLALGNNGSQSWRVGVIDGEGGVLGGVALEDGEALMTSGRYAKYREGPAGERWPHVLNPFTGQPETGARLSVVLHPDPARADAAATALLAAGPAHFEALVSSMRLGCALLVDAEGRVWITEGMGQRFEWQRPLPEAERVDSGRACGTR
jgi:thiamine biosynthesis lipoprotein